MEDIGGFLTTVERRGDPSRSGRDWWILGCNGVNLRPQDTRRKLHGVSMTAKGSEGGYQGGWVGGGGLETISGSLTARERRGAGGNQGTWKTLVGGFLTARD